MMVNQSLCRVVLGVAIAACLRGAAADAATFYTAVSGGDDSRSCATAQIMGTPKATINSAMGCLAAGDTLFVRGGFYDEYIYTVPSGTSWSNKIRMAAYPGETVWMKPTQQSHTTSGITIYVAYGHYFEFDGINVDSSLVFGTNVIALGNQTTTSQEDANHIRFQNMTLYAGVDNYGGSANINVNSGDNEFLHVTVHGGGLPGLCGFQCASYAIYFAGSGNLADNCEFYDTSGAGVQIYCNSSHDNCEGRTPDNNIVRNTKIHDIVRTGSLDEVWGIVVVGSNNQIYNNVIYGINVGNSNAGNAGIAVTNYGNKIWNNTIFNKTNSGIRVDGGASSTEVRNNIVYQVSGALLSDAGSGTIATNNLLGTDPHFVNAATGDFHLQASSTAAINAGMCLSTVTADFGGLARPQGLGCDIGAYEYVVAGPVPAAPTGLHIVQ